MIGSHTVKGRVVMDQLDIIEAEGGWGGGVPRPYTHLSEVLLPELRRRGIAETTLTGVTHDNPFNAYARPLQ
ncbi:MAG TPA: hypothetical protein VGK53_20575 [Propionicimonas sp.]